MVHINFGTAGAVASAAKMLSSRTFWRGDHGRTIAQYLDLMVGGSPWVNEAGAYERCDALFSQLALCVRTPLIPWGGSKEIQYIFSDYSRLHMQRSAVPNWVNAPKVVIRVPF